MKLIRQNISEEIDLTSPVADISASHALVTNVAFSNGKTSSIVTLFNCKDFSFEEVKIGVDTGLERQDWLGIITTKSILYQFINGKLKKSIEFISK